MKIMGCVFITLIIGAFALTAIIAACNLVCNNCPYKDHCRKSIESGNGPLCDLNQDISNNEQNS